MVMPLITIMHVVVLVATVEPGEVYVFDVVLPRAVKQFLVLGCVYALMLYHVVAKLLLHLTSIGMMRTCMVTSPRIGTARR